MPTIPTINIDDFANPNGNFAHHIAIQQWIQHQQMLNQTQGNVDDTPPQIPPLNVPPGVIQNVTIGNNGADAGALTFTVNPYLEGIVKEKKVNILFPFSKFVSYGPLHLNKSKNRAYEKTLPNPSKYKFVMDDALVGIEIEVENIRNTITPEHYWQVKADGSLRNYGVELVSQPLETYQIEYALNYAYEILEFANTPDFSNRTSIHIHLNCRDLTPDELWVLVILYSIFEKHFYSFAGTRRLNSIFCVPIFRTNILSKLEKFIYSLDPNWSKYCGLNLLPMFNNGTTGCYGTIEFRHLYGTNDKKLILEWINSILCLRKAAKTIKKDDLLAQVLEMNTTSSYLSLYNTVFDGVNKLLYNKDDFESCISNVKRELFGNDYTNTLNKYDKSPYWQIANELNTGK